ncbi:MAG: hypothetical protein WC732_07475 [Candidatus Omnitrophota bacterium]
MKKSGVFFFALLAAALLFAKPGRAEWTGLHGFAEQAFGLRLNDDKLTKRKTYNMLEQRLQLKSSYVFSQGPLSRWQGFFQWKGDFTLDEYFGEKTDFELREAFLNLNPEPFLDMKVGRQVLTWGTGDYLFINDVFPKDYVSFYIGRDDEYLKKPSDALRLSFYPQPANVDIVISRFAPNDMPEGDRLSFFDPFQGQIAGRTVDRVLLEPSRQAENLEYAGRIYRNFASTEAALYVFRGFDKIARSYKNEALRQLYYERQDVFGASLRGPFGGGVASVEGAYVRSPEDPHGDNRLIENSMVKLMAGYEKDLGGDLKIGFQYYYEQKLDYGAYARSLQPGDFLWDEHRHLLTQRLTKLFKGQTVAVSLFNFYSPSDHDGYLRLSVSYDLSDRWKLVAGANLPWGEDDWTEFGQMKKNKNIYFRARLSF